VIKALATIAHVAGSRHGTALYRGSDRWPLEFLGAAGKRIEDTKDAARLPPISSRGMTAVPGERTLASLRQPSITITSCTNAAMQIVVGHLVEHSCSGYVSMHESINPRARTQPGLLPRP